MIDRRWQLPAALAFWPLAIMLAFQVSAFQSERAVVVLEPLDEACGSAYLEGDGGKPAKPIGIQGSFVVEPHGGAVVLEPSSGSIRARLIVFRGDRVVRSGEAVATPGAPFRLKARLFGVRLHQPIAVPAALGFTSCASSEAV